LALAVRLFDVECADDVPVPVVRGAFVRPALLLAAFFAPVPAACSPGVDFVLARPDVDALVRAAFFVGRPPAFAALAVARTFVRFGRAPGWSPSTALPEGWDSPSGVGSAIARLRALSAAARIKGPSIATGDASLLHPAGVPSCRRTLPGTGGGSKLRCSSGSGSRGLS